MKITMSREWLTPLLTQAAGFASTKEAERILASVRLEARGDALSIKTTNLDTSFQTKVSAIVEQAGAVSVPAKELAAVVQKMPADQIVLETDSGRAPVLVVSSGRARFRLVAADGGAVSFPATPDAAELELTTIPGAALKDAMTRAGYAAAADGVRPMLSSVRLGEGDAVATDGHCLAWISVDGLGRLGPKGHVLVPAKPLKEIARVAAEVDTVEIGTDAAWLVVRAGDVVVSARLEEGAYPDVAQAMPGPGSFAAVFARHNLVGAIGRARQLGDIAATLRFGLGPEAVGLKVVSSKTSEEFEEEIVSVVSGEPPEQIRLSIDLLKDAVHVVRGDEIEISGTGPIAAVLVSAPGDGENRHVVMPMMT